MADPIDLGAALDAIITDLAAKFPTFKTVAAEDESRTELMLPALIVQMSELEPQADADPHTGQFPCLVHIEVRVVMGHRTPKVRREVVKAAGAVAACAHQSRFGIPWGAATIIGVDPDEFSPAASQFDIWMIEWVHQADIGESFFVDDGVTPTQILTSWAPDIGVPNEDKYVAEDQ